MSILQLSITPEGSLTVDENGLYDVETYAELITEVPTSVAKEVLISEEMDSYLTSANLGQMFIFKGTTDEKYTNGWIYVVKEK